MIFYFTGTGNSLYGAWNIAETQGDQLISIAKEMDRTDPVLEYTLGENELLGFVFPVYAWAPPKIVLDFIGRMQIKVVNSTKTVGHGSPGRHESAGSHGSPYVFSLCTCGGEEGKSTAILQRTLAQKGFKLDSAFSLRMPSNYIVGSEVEPKDIEAEKLRHGDERLQEINQILSARKTGQFQLIPGSMPGLKSSVVNFFFSKFALNTKQFTVTEACTACGICEKLCPIHTITVTDRPTWKTPCTQCLACINRCPVHAIQYGKGTANRGRYQHPALKQLSPLS